MRTLHAYFARELLKTFALTSIALTMLIVMGGGVANIFRNEGIGAEEMVKVFAFLTPVAITLILPVAALFSATITYGRASADNEINACRAAGINIHRLLLSAGILGLFVTLCTLLSWNYIIPGLSARIEDITRKGLSQILLNQFQKARPLAFGKYRIMANHCVKIDPILVTEAKKKYAPTTQPEGPGNATTTAPGEDAPAEDQLSDSSEYLQLSGVSFLEIENQELLRYGTADETIVEFDLSPDKPTATVTVDLQGVRTFDATRRQYFELQHQILGPIPVPMTIKRKIKFENLQTLRRLLRDPHSIPEVDERLLYLTRDIMTVYLAEEVDAALSASRPFRLISQDLQYDISANRWRIDQESGQPKLEDVSVVEQIGQVRKIYHADTASMELKSALIRQKPVILVSLGGNVEVRPENPAAGERVVRRAKQDLTLVKFFDQPVLENRVKRFDLDAVLDPDVTMQLPTHQTKLRTSTIKLLQKYLGEISGEIHFRFSYALCTIAIVLAGTILGIIVRNGQVLTAFGISCLPMAFVVVSSIVGRNLADRPHLSALSVAIMWGGTLIMYGVTALIGIKFLKR